jgi:predicted nucleic acid-binding protein
MRCMSADRFVDTNVWVYAHTQEPRDIRGPQAKCLVEDGTRFVISTQVLSEYYAAMLKNGATDSLIQQNLEAMMVRCEVRLIDLSVIRLAHRLKIRYRFSYWDSLVISSALDAGCTTLYSEDLQHGQHIEDRLHIVNPLLPNDPLSCTESGMSTPPV